MEQFNEILQQQERLHAARLLKEHGLICKQLQYGDCAPLYIAKPNWTNRFDQDRESTIGIFCSIWVTPKLLREKQFAYNIHSKNIRSLPGYKLTSIKFASDFRDLVESNVADWPSIRLDYGPTTLLEGRENCELDGFAQRVDERIFGFTEISKTIDDLLDSYRS